MTVYFPEHDQDLDGFRRFLSENRGRAVGFDTETTGLDIYSPGFGLRLAQFGSRSEAWVLRVDRFAAEAKRALETMPALTAHNATFDLLVADRHLGVPLEVTHPRTLDTRIAAHLIDPRQKQEGGVGLGLKELAGHYIDPEAPDTQSGLHAEFRKIRNPDTGKLCTKADGWRHIPIDHPVYVLYAGLDTILGVRLLDVLGREVMRNDVGHLFDFEHKVQRVLARMQRRGVLVDVEYTERLRFELQAEAEHYAQVAADLGVANINAPKQVAEALLRTGEDLRERTPSGAWKVDKSVLAGLADLALDLHTRVGARDPNPIAEAVLLSKRAAKWSESYVSAFLNSRDSEDRLHASINGLQARTARMSISDPPLQQLPSGDWKIRRCLVADPGKVIVASDYSQVEMRVLAALCGDETLQQAIVSGADLHDFTAERVFGPGFTKAQRKIAKAIGFGKVYGGGAATIQRQTGADMPAVKGALAAYDATFPGIKQYADYLQRLTGYGSRPVITPTGRRLPLDRDRTYAATNYVVQSTARDLLAQALVDLDKAGLGDHLLLPVHDEIVAQADAVDAEAVVKEIGDVMDGVFKGIPIVSDPEVYGASWGHGYGAPDDA